MIRRRVLRRILPAALTGLVAALVAQPAPAAAADIPPQEPGVTLRVLDRPGRGARRGVEATGWCRGPGTVRVCFVFGTAPRGGRVSATDQTRRPAGRRW